MTILATFIVLGVLIFVHEFGHFLAARAVGIRVERFSIGFGPRVFGFIRGDTEYVVSVIPLGGYVKMGGMDDEVMETIEGEKATGGAAPDTEGELRREGDFDQKPLWARAWVISAGVAMNMFFAFLLYSVVAAGWGNPELDTTRIGAVRAELLPDGASALARLPAGSTLVRVGDEPVSHWGEVSEAILSAPDGTLSFSYVDPVGQVTVPVVGDDARQRVQRSLEFWSDPVIDGVNPGTPADRAGIRRGDRVLAVDGVGIRTWPQFVAVIQSHPDSELEVTLGRDGGSVVRRVTPARQTLTDPVTGERRTIGQIGVIPTLPGATYSPIPLVAAIRLGWMETAAVTELILGFVRDLFTGQVSARSLGSIVTIGEQSGQAAAEGLPVFLRFMAFFSVNLAVLNLLPIPVLDGGHLLFLGVEALRGRPLSVRQRLRWSQVGFVFLIGVMALALGNDLLRVFGH
ncbi:MAG: RIP metalloprotease RseP [Gemmatimonadetes bacterium]|nr:RIP metalloprotease RseP [Gemmatimonadota bacterium]